MNTAPRFLAIAELMLRKPIAERKIHPALMQVSVSGGFILGRDENDVGFNRFLCSVPEFQQAWSELNLNPEERILAERSYPECFA